MSVHYKARMAARDVWQRAKTNPLLSPEELRDLEMALNDLEHARNAHFTAAAEKRRQEVERVAS